MNITNRTTHDVKQGTGPWLRLREGFFTASEAPAALGVSKYVTRAQLLRRKFTGVADEPDAATLGKFKAGHDAEALARPLAEGIAEGDLYPVTMSVQVAGLPLLASLDGLTLDGEIAWETKLWNEELAAHVRAGTLPEHYTVQMDQELLVSGAKRCLFTCTDGTPERLVSCWYETSDERIEALLSGWLQFKADLAAYVMPEAAPPAAVGKAPETLPALRIEVTGAVTASNLGEFRETALAAIRSVNRTLKTDQDFADAERAVKWCAEVESRLKAAKDHALSQTASIDALFKALDDIGAEARTVRLDLDKLVARRKTEVKEEAVAAARRALEQHVAAINAEIAPMRLPPVPADFGGAIKGLRSVASMDDKLQALLASAKVACDALARGIRANVVAFKEQASGFEFLFVDLGQIVHKAPEDFAATLQARIAAHKEAEVQRERMRVALRQAEEERQAMLARKRAEDEAAAAAAQVVSTVEKAAAVVAPPPFVPGTPVRNSVAPETVSPPAAPRADEPATLRLGTICDRLGFALTSAFVETALHVKPARVEGAAKLYRPSDFERICTALQQHIDRVRESVVEAA